MARACAWLGCAVAVVLATGANAAAGDGPVTDPARWVNPFVGTDGHGHTFPGASAPFGLVQASPDTRVLGWDACAGYHYSDRFIYGFSHTHLSGVGIPDYCDILVAPQVGKPSVQTPHPEKSQRGYGSRFSHEYEQAEPGYYRVKLLDPGVNVELTTTQRVALHRHTFPEKQPRWLVVDLEHRDLVLDAELQVRDNSEIVGLRRSAAWAKDQLIHFVIRFEKPVQSVQLFSDGVPVNGDALKGKKLKALVRLADETPGDSGHVQFKVALSPVSVAGARGNLNTEMPGWVFETERARARAVWNSVLGKIRITGADEAQLRTFHTALYHCYLSPTVFNDADGTYRGRDGRVHHASHDYSTIFSLWDTYRAWHPLMTLLEPERSLDFIRTFLLMYQQGGLLPVWDLAGNETFCMNGYHAVSVIADAYAKGIRGFDAELALEAMRHSATRDHFGLEAYKRDGYIARERGREGVSRTLEYAYDDACIGWFAGALGETGLRDEYLTRSQNYRHLFSPKEKFFVGRENGRWYTPFNPREINFNYTEGNAWQYRFSAPHDLHGLIDLFGGETAFGAALDALFSEPVQTEGREQADVTGLIGQYAHGNEPDHHVPYLYHYIGRPHETQRRVREIMRTLYSDKPDGLCGNEDCGQMSAWYVLSALGLYQIIPGVPEYVIGSPLFDRATLDLGGGKSFQIVAHNQGPRAVYVTESTLNGRPLGRSYLTHDEITAGGILELQMSDKPGRNWGVAQESRPKAARTTFPEIVEAPIVEVPISFRDQATMTLAAAKPSDVLWYTLDGSDPQPGRSARYSAPVVVEQSATIACVAERGGKLSPIVRAETHRADTGLGVSVRTPINPQYLAGGPKALVDGVLGGPDFTTGRWQGYEDAALDVVVDLGREMTIRKVTVGFLQDANSYIFYPETVQFEISGDGVTFSPLARVAVPSTPRDTTVTTVTRVVGEKAARARYIRVQAPNPGRALAWGSSNEMIKSFLFCDEIQIDRE